jgi:hypothetical protein
MILEGIVNAALFPVLIIFWLIPRPIIAQLRFAGQRTILRASEREFGKMVVRCLNSKPR